MAEEKLTIVDVRKRLARETGVDESTSGAFLASLISNITTGLKNDQLVRIGGLGTFKLQWVEPRRSVNISTGEAITIEGYQKLGFTPDNSLREIINAPFAGLDAIVLDEQGNPLPEQPNSQKPLTPLQKLDKQALEIKDLLADIGQNTPLEEKQDIPESTETTTTENTENTENTDTPEKTEIIEDTETPEESEKSEIVEDTETPEESKESEEKPHEPIKPLKPFRPWLVALITILIFCLMLVAGYFYLQHKVEQWADSLNGKINNTEQPQEPVKDPQDNQTFRKIQENDEASEATEVSDAIEPQESTEPTDLSENTDIPAQSAVSDEQQSPVTHFFEEPRTYNNIKTTVTVNSGSRLAWIAKKQYGRKDFWIFIYEANRDKIKDPANVKVGTELQIPVLPDYILHPTDEQQLVEYVHQLEQKYLH